MDEVLGLVVTFGVSTVVLFALYKWDESRMSKEQRDLCWPRASLRIAVVCFGVLALPVHFYRTRRSALGLLEGLAWAVALDLVLEAVDAGVEALTRYVLRP